MWKHFFKATRIVPYTIFSCPLQRSIAIPPCWVTLICSPLICRHGIKSCRAKTSSNTVANEFSSVHFQPQWSIHLMKPIDSSEIGKSSWPYILWKCKRYLNRLVKRHLISTSIHKHGQPAENKPANVICAQEAFQSENGDKLYSKVLTIEPNRLLRKCSWLNIGAWLRLCSFIVPLLDDYLLDLLS